MEGFWKKRQPKYRLETKRGGGKVFRTLKPHKCSIRFQAGKESEIQGIRRPRGSILVSYPHKAGPVLGEWNVPEDKTAKSSQGTLLLQKTLGSDPYCQVRKVLVKRAGNVGTNTGGSSRAKKEANPTNREPERERKRRNSWCLTNGDTAALGAGVGNLPSVGVALWLRNL